jgi:O-antigen/teichoic acid export membrane protein
MSQKKNLYFSAFEFLVIAVSQFAILRLVSVNLGVAEIGIWSILVASVQMSKLFDPGAVAGSLKYISLSAMKNDKRSIEDYVASSLFLVVIVYVPVLSLLYIFLDDFIMLVFDDARIENALYLVPYICLSFFIQIVSLCFVGAINNMGLGYFKSTANIIGMLIQLILSIALIEQYGLLGLTIAQIINYGLVVILALVIMAFYLKLNIFRFVLFKVKIIRNIFKIGVTVQATSIAWTMFEFSTRMLIARLGGLEMSGYYEVAYRFASQARILSAYLLAPITPLFVQKYSESTESFRKYYTQIYSNITALGLFFMFGVFALSPLLSLLMFEEVNGIFLFFIVTAGIGAFLHIIALVSECSAVSLGLPRYNLIGMVTILICTYLLAFPLGYFFGAFGVAIGVLFAILIGATVTIYNNSFKLLNVPFFPSFRLAINQFVVTLERKTK